MSDQPHHRHRLRPAARGRSQDVSRDDLIIGATLDLLGEGGYHALTMSDVAARAGVSKATLYRRWTAKADLVSDAVATLGLLTRPDYPGTSIRDDLLTLLEQAGGCADRHQIVATALDVARTSPDLARTLRARFTEHVRREIGALAARSAEEGHAALSSVEIDHVADTAVALLVHFCGPTPTPPGRERLAGVVDHVLMVLLTRPGEARSAWRRRPDESMTMSRSDKADATG